jgi:hypothetical protein
LKNLGHWQLVFVACSAIPCLQEGCFCVEWNVAFCWRDTLCDADEVRSVSCGSSIVVLCHDVLAECCTLLLIRVQDMFIRFQGALEPSFSRRIIGVELNTFFDLRKSMLCTEFWRHIAHPTFLIDLGWPGLHVLLTWLFVPPSNTIHRSNSLFVQGAGKWNDVLPEKEDLILLLSESHYLVHFGWAADRDGWSDR